jgi:hypothetical protein
MEFNEILNGEEMAIAIVMTKAVDIAMMTMNDAVTATMKIIEVTIAMTMMNAVDTATTRITEVIIAMMMMNGAVTVTTRITEVIIAMMMMNDAVTAMMMTMTIKRHGKSFYSGLTLA